MRWLWTPNYLKDSAVLSGADFAKLMNYLTPHVPHLVVDDEAKVVLRQDCAERFAADFWDVKALGDYKLPFPVCHHFAKVAIASLLVGAAECGWMGAPGFCEAKTTLVQGRHDLLAWPVYDAALQPKLRWFQGQNGVWSDDFPGLISVDSEEA